MVAGAGLGLYLRTSFPFPDWLDGPELAAAAHRLGVFHPPGSPLAVLLGHLFTLWPLALTAFSAFFAAACLYVLARLIQGLWDHLGPRGRGLRDAVCLLLTSAFGLAPGLWSQAVRLEVYTLAFLLFLCALREILGIYLDASGDSSWRAFKAAAFVGMGLCVHPLVILAAVASGIPLLLTPAGRAVVAPRQLGRLALSLLLGSIPLLLLPLMVHDPMDLRFGDPATIGGWLSFVTGAAFQPSFSAPSGTMVSGGLRALAVVATGLGLPLVIASILGCYLLLRIRWRLALALVLAAAACTLTLALQRSVRLDNPDVTGYALPAMAAIALLAVCGLAVAGRLLGRWKASSAWLTSALAAAAVLYAALSSGVRLDRSGCTAGKALAVRALLRQPRQAVLLLADFNLVFMFDYLTRVERVRPDLTVLYLRDLDNPALREALAEQDEQLEALLPGLDDLNPASLKDLAGHRPVALDIGPHLDSRVLSSLVPWGLTWHLHPPLAEEDLLAAQEALLADLAPPRCATGLPVDQRTAEVVAWHATWQGLAAHGMGLHRLAERMLHAALCASPHDRNVADALVRLGLPWPQGCTTEPSVALPATRAERPAPLRAVFLLLGLLAWAGPLVGPVWKHRAGWRKAGTCTLGILVLAVVVALG